MKSSIPLADTGICQCKEIHEMVQVEYLLGVKASDMPAINEVR